MLTLGCIGVVLLTCLAIDQQPLVRAIARRLLNGLRVAISEYFSTRRLVHVRTLYSFR